jgi:NADP-dependent 3-hydroxy acid dehydrogenase YdfG
VKPVLDGTVALVTGASSGIGAATATALAAQGAAVALAARRADRLEALAADIMDQGGTALVLEVDVTDEQQATGAVERTVAELGRLDTLINNAGVMLLGPVAGAPLPEWQQMVQLNVLGLLYCAHAALPHLLRAAQDGPRQVADMVNISSVAGRAARNGNGVYSLTKHGVGAFSESLRQEVTWRYVRVSLVEPGAGQLAERLDDMFTVLVGGARTAPRRHQALRAALDWSHDPAGRGRARGFPPAGSVLGWLHADRSRAGRRRERHPSRAHA